MKNEKVATKETTEDRGIVLCPDALKLSQSTIAAAVCWKDKLITK